MAGGKQLAYAVVVTDDNDTAHTFTPRDDVPGWAAKKITNPEAWASRDGSAADGGSGSSPDPSSGPAYADMKKADLEAEVQRRNDGRDDEDHIEVGGTGTKADLVEALQADDDAAADGGSGSSDS